MLRFLLLVCLVVTALTPIAPSHAQSSAQWAEVEAALQASGGDPLLLVVATAEGVQYQYTIGDIAMDSVLRIASSSKWLSAATLMTLVEADLMSLDDHPQDYIPWWTDDPADPRSQITLADLLAFRSGFAGDDDTISCIGNGRVTLEDCARDIYDGFFEYSPATTYYYSPAHLNIAGVMAEYATGLPFADIFTTYVAEPLGMSDTAFKRPSHQNPRPAGGANSSPRDYLNFLGAMFNGEFLADEQAVMFADQTPNTVMAERPNTMQGGDAHYAFGAWRECHLPVWDSTCAEDMLLSSPGASGWYPWLDLSDGYYGLLVVVEGVNGNGRVQLMQRLYPLIEAALDIE